VIGLIPAESSALPCRHRIAENDDAVDLLAAGPGDRAAAKARCASEHAGIATTSHGQNLPSGSPQAARASAGHGDHYRHAASSAARFERLTAVDCDNPAKHLKGGLSSSSPAEECLAEHSRFDLAPRVPGLRKASRMIIAGTYIHSAPAVISGGGGGPMPVRRKLSAIRPATRQRRRARTGCASAVIHRTDERATREAPTEFRVHLMPSI